MRTSTETGPESTRAGIAQCRKPVRKLASQHRPGGIPAMARNSPSTDRSLGFDRD